MNKDLNETAVIIPCIVSHNLDPHTGIPFMPHMAAHLAGEINKYGYEPQIIDCFGLNPHKRRIIDDLMLLGVDENFVVENLSSNIKIVFLYCRTIEDFISTERIAKEIKEKKPHIKLIFFENNQTVNSFALEKLAPEILTRKGDLAVFGEPEDRVKNLLSYFFENNIDIDLIKGIAYLDKNSKLKFNEKSPFSKDLDNFSFPYW